MKSAMAFMLTTMLIVVQSLPVYGDVKYTVTDLGALGGGTSIAYGINNSGQVVGRSQTASGHPHAFLYYGGVMTDLGTLGGSSSIATSINNNGQIVGSADRNDGLTRAFLYSGGVMQDLGVIGGSTSNSEAKSINDNGQVTGQSAVWGISASHAFLFSGGMMQDLGTLTGSGGYSEGNGINSNGQVVGSSTTSGGMMGSFLYSNGTMTELHSNLWPTASAINDSGQIVGTMQGGAFLYSNGVLQNIGSLGYGGADGFDINNAGQVVGEAYTAIGDNHAFLYSDGAMVDLNTLLSPDSGWTLVSARGINDSGQIVGFGRNPENIERAFLLTPVPEPATLSILTLGGIALGMRSRRIHSA